MIVYEKPGEEHFDWRKEEAEKYMRIMQQGGRKKKGVSVAVMLLLCICTACGNVDSENNETENTEQENTPVQSVEEVEKEEKKGIRSGAIDGGEQVLFTVEDLPEEIKTLLNYESWTDDTQAVFCTQTDIENSGMPEEFQQIINGDFSGVQGLRAEEEREELREDYEKRENWAYMIRDMDRDGIAELCIKDHKGRIGIFFEVYGGSYMPGMIEIWSFGERESNLLTEEDCGANDYFLNNGQFAKMFKSGDESSSYFWIKTSHLSEGTFPTIEEMSIFIINDISPSSRNVVNYEKPGIYYEIARYEGDEYIHEEVTEQDAAEWCEDNIYPYMMSEEEWYAVP